MEENNQQSECEQNRIRRLTILELLTVLAALGILLTWVMRRFFLS